MEGLVPAAYVELFPPTATATPSTPLSGRPASSYSHSSTNSVPPSTAGSVTSAPGKKKGPAVAPKRGAKKLKYVEALYDYEARSDAEHSIAEGERFVLINKDSGDGKLLLVCHVENLECAIAELRLGWADVEKGGVTKSVPGTYHLLGLPRSECPHLTSNSKLHTRGMI